MKALTMSVASMALAALTALGQAGAIGNKTELRRSLASARTAADHARIAAYLNPYSPGNRLLRPPPKSLWLSARLPMPKRRGSSIERNQRTKERDCIGLKTRSIRWFGATSAIPPIVRGRVPHQDDSRISRGRNQRAARPQDPVGSPLENACNLRIRDATLWNPECQWSCSKFRSQISVLSSIVNAKRRLPVTHRLHAPLRSPVSV